jgi:outer membrane protein OmpA-like peptidoglycan-associated protein
LLLLCTFYASVSTAQIHIDTAYAAEYLVKEILLGEGVIAGNIRYTGARRAIGFFSDSTRILSIQEGILLTSGSAMLSKGPNTYTDMQLANKTAGYPKLEAIANGRTHDAAILEFDFVTSAENLSFDFIFASEEYTEYVGSKYNDVFGFFIYGPGLDNVNLAVLPGSSVPVTINSINHKKNRKYYIDNPTETINDPIIYDVRRKTAVRNKNYGKVKALPPYNIQYDGFTTLLQAACKVVPGEIYHIEIAIADVSDFILDSGVYLAGHSFRSTGSVIIPVEDPFRKAPPADTMVVELPAVPEVPSYIPVVHEARVEFIFDTYFLTDSATSVLSQYYRFIKEQPQAMIEVTGHTDDWGTDTYNEVLSRNRAESVARYLIQLGVPARQIHIDFKGEKAPVEANETAQGRTRNRRVELVMKL